MRTVLFLTVSAVLCCVADARSSTLGLEPGDIRLQNDDIGVILWGPDAAPTLSVGKSDIWDRRNLTSAGKVGVERDGIRSVRLRARDGNKAIDLRVFVSADRKLILWILIIAAAVSTQDDPDPLTPEHFIQSYTGVIRVFPATPSGFDGGFENLGAQGAFVVSSRRTAHGVTVIDVRSLAGNPARVANPWPETRVTDKTAARSVSIEPRARILRFATVKGHEYRLEPVRATP